jgi:hypothetical protein
MNLDQRRCTSNNEGEIKSSTHQLKQDDVIMIGSDIAKNPPHPHRFQRGPLDQATFASSSTDSQAIDSVLITVQDFFSVSSNNWQCEDENSRHLSFADSTTFLQEEEDYEERDGDETDDDEDEDSICDSIIVTVRRRLKQCRMSSSDNE